MSKKQSSKSSHSFTPHIDSCRLAIGSAVAEAINSKAGSVLVDSQGAALSLEKPPNPEMGDYAFPTFRYIKPLGLKPPDLIAFLQNHENISGCSWIERTEARGAFFNIFVNQSKLAQAVLPTVSDGSLFEQLKSRTEKQAIRVMIEHSQLNTHKESHVGHGRNICLGDCLVRLFRYCGYQTIATNYPGDEGTHIAKCLWMLRKKNLNPPQERRGAWLGKIYAQADRTLKEADADQRLIYDREISQILAAIESKQGEIFELWKTTRQWSLDDFDAIYDLMDVHFDTYFFESEVSGESQKIVDEYLEKKIFVEDQGAIGVDLKEYKLGFSLLRKSDGNTLYATKDLCLARRKFDEHNIDRSIYVVADEQNLHFRQVFKTLELMGFEKAAACFHLSYGMVMLPEGKMSTRQGNSITFQELLDAVIAEVRVVLKKYEGQWDEAEISQAAQRLAIGTIKYGMLSSDPVKSLVFNLKEWLSFEGNSGPYLMYTWTRTQSILRKASEQNLRPSYEGIENLNLADEHAVVRLIYDFNSVVENACELYKPSSLAHYLFESCKAFNRFYKHVPVLKGETPAIIAARLGLVESFGLVLKQGLDLIGMTPPERM
jgi:arginyl-tRNA synthetase